MRLPDGARAVDPEAEAERLAQHRIADLLRVEITGGAPGTAAVRVACRLLPCTEATLALSGSQTPELTVRLAAADLAASLDARVRLSRETRAALIAMGWREPA